MNLKTLVRAALVRFYPAPWRREYGEEFAAVLAQRPLTPRAVLNVLGSALWQHLRLDEPWLVIGIPLFAWNLYQWTMLILFPPPYHGDTFTVNAAGQVFGILLFLSVGFWTIVRHGPKGHAGRAVGKMSLLINSPLCLMAILAAFGILRIIAVGPGDPVTTFHEHGFAVTMYDHTHRPPALAGLFVIPFLSAPEAMLFGWLGGLAARHAPRFRRSLHG